MRRKIKWLQTCAPSRGTGHRAPCAQLLCPLGRGRNTELDEKNRKGKLKRDQKALKEGAEKKRRGDAGGALIMNKMATVITETEDMDAMYRPKTKDTATAYEDILNFIRKSLGDQPQDILHGAAEETISLLKDDRFVGRQKQVEVEKVLTKMQPERFNALVQHHRLFPGGG